MSVCKIIDRDRAEMEPRWEVTLNNGETIYSDDGVGNPPSAWERLQLYCQDNNLHIIEMSFGFRSNMKYLPKNADGYFFCRGALGMYGSTRTLHYFIVGTLQNGILQVTKWKVPEMLDEETEIRDPLEAGKCLITKNMYQSMVH